MQELCCQTRNVFLFLNFLPEFLSSNKSTVSQIQSKWPFLIFLFLFSHCLNKNHWHILKEKLKVGVCTWTDSFGISQTRFINQTSVDSLTHFLISSLYLWNFFHSLMEVYLWLFCKAFWGETWTGKCSNSQCFTQNYRKVSRSYALTFRINGHCSLSKENNQRNSKLIAFNFKNKPKCL